MAVSCLKRKFGPDSQRSVVIAIYCCLLLFFLTMVLRTQGYIFVSIIRDYGATREEASYPQSIGNLVLNFLSPLIAIATHMLSPHKVGVICSFLLSSSLLLCYFCNNVLTLVIFYGILQGIFGVGVYATSQVMLAEHFVKYRTVAFSMASFFATLNTFILPLIESWCEQFDTNITIVLIGVFTLNCIPLAMVIKSPEKLPANYYATEKEKTKTKTQKQFENFESVSLNSENEKNVTKSQQLGRPRTISCLEVEGSCSEFSTSTLELNKKDTEHKTSAATTATNKSNAEDAAKTKSSHFDFLRNSLFYLDAVSCATVANSLLFFLMLAVDFAKDMGVPEHQTTYILQSFCVGDMLMRAICGFLVDHKLISVCSLMWIGALVQTFCLASYAHFSSVSILMGISFLFGATTGSRMFLLPVLLAKDCGLESLTSSLTGGYITVGVFTLLRPLLIGYFRDQKGDYAGLFYVYAVVNAIIAVLWLLRWIKEKYSDNRSKT